MMFFKMALLSAAAAQAAKKNCADKTLASMDIKTASHGTKYTLPKNANEVTCKAQHEMDQTDLEHIKCDDGTFVIKYKSKKAEENLEENVSPCKKKKAVACKDDTLKYGKVKTQQAADYYSKKDFTTKNLTTVLTCTNGSKVNPKLTNITCLGDGTWMFEANKNLVDKEDLCIKDSKPCKDDTVTNGTVKTQKAEHLDTKAVFTKNSSTKLADVLACNNGYERATTVTQITCNGDGTWDYHGQQKNLCVKKKAVTTPKPTPAVTTTTPKPTPVTECPDLPVANGKLLKQTPPTAAKKEYTLTDNTILKCNATFERKITKVTCDGATGTWFNGTNKIAKNAKDLCKEKNKKNKTSGALLVGTAAAAVLLL